MDFWVGTLTREGGEGILRCRLENGRLRRVETIREIKDPNYVILSADQKVLYAVNSDPKQDGYTGFVNAYDITGDAARLLSHGATGGSGPCFLTLSSDGRHLYAANYATGSLAAFAANDGLAERIQLIQRSGSGPHPTRQNGPHLHQVTFIPGSPYLCAVDLGADELITYRRDPASGLLTEHACAHLHGGPRHIVYGRGGLAYLAHELSNEVTVLRLADGRFTPLQTLSTLPEGTERENTAAAIRLSGDGKRLYVSNRGFGTVASFLVGADGLLTAEAQLFAGVFPRDFVLLDDGAYLVADQRAGVYYLGPRGERLDFLPQMGAVCLCPQA